MESADFELVLDICFDMVERCDLLVSSKCLNLLCQCRHDDGAHIHHFSEKPVIINK